MQPSARRFGVVWTIAWLQLGILLLFVAIGRTGTAARLFTEQLAWAVGLGITGSRNPDGYVAFVHLVAIVTLLVGLVAWQRGSPRARLALRVAAGGQFLIAPLGVATGLALWWASRQDHFITLSERMETPAGAARARVSITWLGATALVVVLSIPAYILLELNLLLWFGAAWSCALPQVGALYALGAERKRPERDAIPAAMPPLPDLGRHP